MGNIYLCLIAVFLVELVYSNSEENKFDPVIVSSRINKRGFPVFRGVIDEDQREVKLDYPLQAYDNDTEGGARLICGYRLLLSKPNVPFFVEIQNRFNGSAAIKVVEGKKLNYERRSRYKLSIVAYDCGMPDRESRKAVIFIRVRDVDEYAPRFEHTSFFVEMEERRIYDSLLVLRATDGDRSPEYQRICGYQILTQDVPFQVDNKGNLRNTEEILYSQRHNFILQVIAVDCGGKRSKTVYINIKIKEVCRSGWTGIPNHLNYDAGSGQQKVIPGARLRWCDNTCQATSVRVKMHLATRHIGKGCDRDTYSITSQRKLCGASDDSVDLLPPTSLTTTYTDQLTKDDGNESDQIYFFDGQSNAVEVPENHFNHSLHQHFTISTWMKHDFPEATVSPSGRSPKEHIICMSDGEGMSRHHYSWFVHGEKLVFLLRREAADSEDMEVFRPAEWRWHIPQINDGEWHYYAISVDFPHLRLYIDGKLLIPDDSNLEVLDDWPLQRSKQVHSNKLVVGACWQARESSFKHYFKGYLAGLSILKGKTESDRVIHCLNSCKENLDFHGTNTMKSGTSVSFNSEMTEFTLTGHNVKEVENLVKEVVYVNSRQFPTPGRRNVDVSTTIRCGNQDHVLPVAETYILVHPAPVPSIAVTGAHNKQATAYQLKNGIKVFQNIRIQINYPLNTPEDVEESEDEEGTTPQRNKAAKLQRKLERVRAQQETVPQRSSTQDILLDMCTVRADPPLDFHFEHLSMPQSTITQHNMKIEGSETNSGLVIVNADTRENYEHVLRELYYYHNEERPLGSRKFFVSCSSQNGRFISNQLEITIVEIHPQPRTVVHAHAQQHQASVQHFKLENSVSGAGSVGAAHASPNVGMVAIIVVCVGFLLFMIILGVIRIRAAHRRTQVVQVKEDMEMEWDNSGLNITVNPMEQKEVFEYEDTPMKLRGEDSDTDDDSYHDDCDSSEEEDEDEEETTVKKVRGDLEWDDSTMSF